jgi:3',5'-cyclic AMP phosphodiesterase CpdA
MIAPGALEDEFPGSTPSRLLHLSDTHFGTEVPAVADALKRLCEQQRPEVAVLSGDVTQRARPGQFAAAARFLKTLAVPQTLVLPGNHDVPLFDLPARLMRPYAQFQAAFGYELESLYSDAHWLVITVNTTRWYRHKNGEIDPVQIQTVAARLRQAAPGQVRIVVTHHPLVVIKEADHGNQPHRHAQALAAWTEAGADLVLGGHIHLPYVTPVEPLAPSTGEGAGLPADGFARTRRVWAVQAGTATSSRIREGIPNSVHLIINGSHRHGRVCEVETWQFDAATAGFQRVALRTLALSV